MLKLFLCLCITFVLHPMEQFLLSAFPAAMSGIVGYSAARSRHLQETEQQSQAYSTLRQEHEQLKTDLSRSGLLIRGTQQVVLCNPLNTLFNRSIENSDEAGMHAVIKNIRDKFDINGLDENGSTALHVAARQKNDPCMEYLHKQGANPDVPDVFGMAPLHYAAQANDLETMALLMTIGADLNIKRPEDGLTPLMAALKANKQEAIAFLLTLKNRRAEMERAPSPDHSVTLLGSLRLALEMQRQADQDARDSRDLIFHAFLERNPECLICIKEMPTDVHITLCCQKGVCTDCANDLAPKKDCPFCKEPFKSEPFFIYQRGSPQHPACSSNSHLTSSS